MVYYEMLEVVSTASILDMKLFMFVLILLLHLDFNVLLLVDRDLTSCKSTCGFNGIVCQ